MIKEVTQTLKKIRETAPLTHNITNYVVMNNTANALLAVGASPVMAHAEKEVEDIVNISSALVINMGTLSENWVKSMLLAAKCATQNNKPFIFDPVGVGASKYRNETASKILATNPTVIRGNASEIMALANQNTTTKGVDSTAASNEALNAAQLVSKKYNTTIVISGAIDYVVTGNNITQIHNGSTMMAKVTGMGCTASAIIGACLGVTNNYHLAAVTAMSIMGVSGEIAAKKSEGPGSFQLHFLDTLYQLTQNDLTSLLKIE